MNTRVGSGLTCDLSVSAGDGGGLTCSICGAEYPERRRLTEHFKKHMGKTTCLLCQREFASMYGLRRHMIMQHHLEQQKVDTLTEKKPPYHPQP